MTTLDESYRYCTAVARKRAKNFYYSFLLLSPPQRKAMCAIYAFMRYCDDLSDDPTIQSRGAAIAAWQADLDNALQGRYADHPAWPAFHDAVLRYRIPHAYFHEMIAGVSSDLEPRRLRTFDELYRYCYQVASVVGLTVIHIFGFESDEALDLAEKCGIAFQITNILRDVREDAENDRVYLPLEDLERFNVSPQALVSAEPPPGFKELMAFEASRAERYYQESMPLIGLIHPGSRASLRALIEIYYRLLGRIRDSGYDVLRSRVRVPAWEKTLIMTRAWLTR